MIASSSMSRQLPVSAFYNMRNSSSDNGWLAYQVSINEVRLIKYTNSITISQGFVFQFTPQPIKQIKVIVDQKEGKVYLAILFLTKYIIYQGNAQLCSYRLKLDRNIVAFENSFVACDAINDSKQIYFTFLTANGEVHIVSVDNIEMKSSVNIGAEGRFCSIKILDNNVVVANQTGKLFLVDLNNSTILKSFDTGSNMPILQLGWINKRVIAITCQGQIFNLNDNLTSFTSLSAHQGLVSHLEIGNNKIYTFGDECVLNEFEIDQNSNDLRLKKSQKYSKRANLLVTLHEETLLNFYEENSLTQVNSS